MYEFLRVVHNILRWLVLLGGLAAVVVTLRGLFTRAAWGDAERRVGTLFVAVLDLQIVIGLILYVVLAQGPGGIVDRFIRAEHPAIMIVAAVVAHVGQALARRAGDDRSRFVRAATGFTVAMALILYGIPWNRPLLP